MTKQSNASERRTALTRRIPNHVLSRNPSGPREVTCVVFRMCRSNRRRAKSLFSSRQSGEGTGRAVFPRRHLACPHKPCPHCQQNQGRYQQCAEAIYGREEIYINQPVDSGHTIRKLWRGVGPLAERTAVDWNWRQKSPRAPAGTPIARDSPALRRHSGKSTTSSAAIREETAQSAQLGAARQNLPGWLQNELVA